jgi:hypothetical protein
MIIKNDGNKNIMEREKYTVKSAGVPLFPNVSNMAVSHDCDVRPSTFLCYQFLSN